MIKADLATAVRKNLDDLSPRDAAEVVDVLFELMTETLEAGEDLKISGFGKWSLRDKRTRKGRNPKTGEPITIAARRVASFKPSELLRQEMNEVK